MEIYLVGGAVRDEFLGLSVHEHDYLVVGATVSDMLAQGFKPVGRDFPVFLHPKTGEEYALARTERKVGSGYHGFAFHAHPDVTLEQDLARRDLTINAMARAPDHRLIDPYHGLNDLHRRRLCHVTSSFSEDPLRIVRVARFSARFCQLGFSIDPSTRELMMEMVHNGEFSALQPERLFRELEKAMQAPRPDVFFSVLEEVGALECWAPQLARKISGWPVDPSAWAFLHFCRHETSPVKRTALLLAACSDDAACCKALAQTLHLPKRWSALAHTACIVWKYAMSQSVLNPDSVIELMDQVDFWRRKERFFSALDMIPSLAWAYGRADLGQNANRIKLAASDIQAFPISRLPKQYRCLEGKALGQALHQARRLRLHNLLE